MWRPHSWQTYNFMRAIYHTHLARIVSVRVSKHLKPHFRLAKCSSALYCSRLFGRHFIHLFIYYCLLRILATKGSWFCVSCWCSQRGFENYILFEDKPADITHCLLDLASRCHLTKIGSRHSCLPHTEKRCCFAAKPNHYSACVYQHIYRSVEKGEGFLPNQHLRSPKHKQGMTMNLFSCGVCDGTLYLKTLTFTFSLGFDFLFLQQKMGAALIMQAQCHKCKTATLEVHLTVGCSLSKPANVSVTELWNLTLLIHSSFRILET